MHGELCFQRTKLRNPKSIVDSMPSPRQTTNEHCRPLGILSLGRGLNQF